MPPVSIITLLPLIFGLILGSFLNVCIHRIPLMESIVFPPSKCPHCGTKIRFYDNIPMISYILLSGRCRSCREPISIRYPLVEVITGLLSMALFIRYGLGLKYLLLLAYSASLVIISFIDLRHQIIPDIISLPGILLGLIVVSIFHLNNLTWLDSLTGILAGGGSLFLVGFIFKSIRGKEGMGMGDVKLLAMIGAWMGWRSLPYVILISSLAGTLIGGSALLFAGRKFSEKIPFGPFLVLGSLSYLFFKTELQSLWYYYLALR